MEGSSLSEVVKRTSQTYTWVPGGQRKLGKVQENEEEEEENGEDDEEEEDEDDEDGEDDEDSEDDEENKEDEEEEDQDGEENEYRQDEGQEADDDDDHHDDDDDDDDDDRGWWWWYGMIGMLMRRRTSFRDEHPPQHPHSSPGPGGVIALDYQHRTSASALFVRPIASAKSWAKRCHGQTFVRFSYTVKWSGKLYK